MTDGITLDRSGTSVTLTDDLSLTREAGRPDSDLRPIPASIAETPIYIDKVRPAVDVFELSGAFTSGTPEDDGRTLAEDIIRPPLGRGSLTLTFANGVWELASYNVVPVGSSAGRVTWSAGTTGMVRVQGLTLRVVDNS